MRARFYGGRRSSKTGEAEVWVGYDGGTGDVSPLPMRNDLANHSPCGPEWGYAGSGPAQLALAILADHLNEAAAAPTSEQAARLEALVVALAIADDVTNMRHAADAVAVRLHQHFKRDHVACLPRDLPWHLTTFDVDTWLLVELDHLLHQRAVAETADAGGC